MEEKQNKIHKTDQGDIYQAWIKITKPIFSSSVLSVIYTWKLRLPSLYSSSVFCHSSCILVSACFKHISALHKCFGRLCTVKLFQLPFVSCWARTGKKKSIHRSIVEAKPWQAINQSHLQKTKQWSLHKGTTSSKRAEVQLYKKKKKKKSGMLKSIVQTYKNTVLLVIIIKKRSCIVSQTHNEVYREQVYRINHFKATSERRLCQCLCSDVAVSHYTQQRERERDATDTWQFIQERLVRKT